MPALALRLALLLPLGARSARVYEEGHGTGNQSLAGLAKAPGGLKRALLVAFTYKSGSKLSGTCYDLLHMADFAKRQGYEEAGFVTDGCPHEYAPDATAFVEPGTKVTQAAMQKAFEWLLAGGSEGGGLLFYYSGHGESVQYKKAARDKAKDECNGFDEALGLPDGSSYIDDDIFRDLVEKVPAGAHLLAIVDACHSGTVLDLPWNFMHQKYYWSCPDDASQRAYTVSQFAWEWAKPAAELERTYPLPGTVVLISGSQNNQKSGDAAMTTFTDKRGRTQTIGGMMTFRLTLDHWDWADKLGINSKAVPNPPILDTALAEGWTYAEMVQELVAQVSGGDLTSMTASVKQIPNFCASDRLDMSLPFSLDGSAFVESAAAKTKCPTHGWMRNKKKLKVC